MLNLLKLQRHQSGTQTTSHRCVHPFAIARYRDSGLLIHHITRANIRVNFDANWDALLFLMVVHCTIIEFDVDLQKQGRYVRDRAIFECE